MGRRIDCPIPGLEDAYVVLPDDWLGEHLIKRDEAVSEYRKMGSAAMIDLGVALTLAEDWRGIPGLEGKPENWDLRKLRAQVINWLVAVVVGDFNKCFDFPKQPSSPSETGSTATME